MGSKNELIFFNHESLFFVYFCGFYEKLQMKTKLLIFFLLCAGFGITQTITNGDFESGNVAWGCSPEIQGASVYGGAGSDIVAEVDQAAGLCQTVSGFTVGSFYTISFFCSRRTNCGPATQSVNFSIDNGALPIQSVSRTGGFSFTLESFGFVATNTTHTINFVGTSPTTCGLIINNVTITLVSPLSIKLTSFDVENSGGFVNINWKTVSETNNDFFTVERSDDGKNWEMVSVVDGAGNSNTLLEYQTTDNNPVRGLVYYRLKQTDFDGKYSYSSIKSLKKTKENNTVGYPNPAHNQFHLRGKDLIFSQIEIYNTLGQKLTSSIKLVHQSVLGLSINVQNLCPGLYFVKTKNEVIKFRKQ